MTNREVKYISIDEIRPNTQILTFDEMVEKLLQCQRMRLHVYCNFNGQMYCSDTIDKDGAYISYYDMTKEEKDHYTINADKIALELIGNGFADLHISDEKYRNYVVRIIMGREPMLLQLYEYTIKLSQDIILKETNPERMERFNRFSEERKIIAKDFIKEFFEEGIQEEILKGLGLNQLQKKK